MNTPKTVLTPKEAMAYVARAYSDINRELLIKEADKALQNIVKAENSLLFPATKAKVPKASLRAYNTAIAINSEAFSRLIEMIDQAEVEPTKPTNPPAKVCKTKPKQWTGLL